MHCLPQLRPPGELKTPTHTSSEQFILGLDNVLPQHNQPPFRGNTQHSLYYCVFGDAGLSSLPRPTTP
jgi:hypothetical protein